MFSKSHTISMNCKETLLCEFIAQIHDKMIVLKYALNSIIYELLCNLTHLRESTSFLAKITVVTQHLLLSCNMDFNLAQFYMAG